MLSKSRPRKTCMGSRDLCRASLVEGPLGGPEAIELARCSAVPAGPVRLGLLSIRAGEGEVCSRDLEALLANS